MGALADASSGSDTMSVDLHGAADLHCHFGPDAHRERSVDAFEAAREAAAAGHRAVVLKSHDFPTASLAWSVGQMVPDIAVFGGICCDREVGGVNPAAVEVALRLCAMTCIGALATRTPAEMFATIRTVGVERVTLGTDFGQKVNPHPAAGLQTYADALCAEGLREDEIRRMACTNPSALLGLDA